MSFSKIMALFTVFTRDYGLRDTVRASLGTDHHVATTRTWERLEWLLRERPVTVAVVDSAVFDEGWPADAGVADLKRRFPSVSVVFVERPHFDPLALFRLGRVAVGGFALVHLEEAPGGLLPALGRVARHGTEGRVVRALGARLPSREVRVVRLALSGVQIGWQTDDLAAAIGFSRAHLSARLRRVGLPSAGHLLIWSKLLHAGRWLSDPGRSAQSVSRQLDYSNGAAFRRVLRNYLGLTPTGLREAGGLDAVLAAFLDACGLSDSVPFGDRSVA